MLSVRIHMLMCVGFNCIVSDIRYDVLKSSSSRLILLRETRKWENKKSRIFPKTMFAMNVSIATIRPNTCSFDRVATSLTKNFKFYVQQRRAFTTASWLAASAVNEFVGGQSDMQSLISAFKLTSPWGTRARHKHLSVSEQRGRKKIRCSRSEQHKRQC